MPRISVRQAAGFRLVFNNTVYNKTRYLALSLTPSKYDSTSVSTFNKHYAKRRKKSHVILPSTSNFSTCSFNKTKYFFNGVQQCMLHTSSSSFQEKKEDFKVLDEKSRIEDFVKYQLKKHEQKEKLKIASQKFHDAFIFKVDHSLPSNANKDVVVDQPEGAIVPAKKPIMQKIRDEIRHYYNGFRLLYLDIRIAGRMLWRVMNGKSLTRRERKQFLRTVADLFRLVPFMVFLIIPFMEFLLPVAIKLFPGMLPSTFEDKKTKDSKMRASLKMKLQMAEFLQDTIEEIAVNSKTKKPSDKLTNFANFVLKTRSEGERPNNAEIMKFSKLFEDEITLENIPHDQLKALCRLIMISPIGTSNFLTFKIKMKLQELKADDQLIRREGIESLSTEELQNACVARGMRAMGVPVERMKSNLRQWLELSLDEDIPASLLLLSRTLYMGPTVAVDQQLEVTISQFPERLIDEMEVKIGAIEGEAVDRQTIIDIIKHEEAQIAAEKAETKKRKAKEEELKQIELAEEKARDEELLKEELLTVKETISTEREELHKIKEDREEYIEELEELKKVEVEETVKESVASSRLGKRIDSMLIKIDSDLKELEDKVRDLPEGKIDKHEDGIVTTSELFDAVKKLRNAPNEAKTIRLLEVLDEDNDGEISLEELRKSLHLVATQDLDLNTAQISEMMSLIRGSEKVYLVEQMINKKKTNYILRLLPEIYGKRLTDE